MYRDDLDGLMLTLSVVQALIGETCLLGENELESQCVIVETHAVSYIEQMQMIKWSQWSHLGLVGRESRRVAEALGTLLGSIASLAKNVVLNIGEVSGLESLLAGGAAEAVANWREFWKFWSLSRQRLKIGEIKGRKSTNTTLVSK